MNLIGLSLVGLCLVSVCSAFPANCKDLQIDDISDCETTEYEEYRTCIEEHRTSRAKRQAVLCPSMIVEPVIHTVAPYEILIPVEPLSVAVKPEPLPNHPLLKSLDRTVIVQPGADGADSSENSVQYRVPLNVTTVIRLTNVVNNTNLIHMPTTLNNTNVNNIHVYANLTETAANESGSETCCTAVRAKNCSPSTDGVRCSHQKYHTCGPQCTAPVVHVQQRKRCNRETGGCQEKNAYVPQPSMQTCVYIDDWPYVACGKVANMSVICAGCYDHYGEGYEAFHGHGQIADHCRGCYDDAFDVGPLYRRGPVLRPFYYHQPPCFLTRSCPERYEDCGYGCYGHDQIDPVWGMPDSDPFDPVLDASNTIFYNPDDVRAPTNETSDWGVPVVKCAEVKDGKTVTLRNCTDSIGNPYMAVSVPVPYTMQQSATQNTKGEDAEETEYFSGDDLLNNDTVAFEEYSDDED
ncbi:uncharacterized protein LOC128731144 [Anopheles nili]|uniref:uncharacterized protein LOC128731144 n=1 Tax=Anopheles nili TaxID=185578 RepID=UPI00237AFAD0|nr:uncharacterized protein LOC128731144 [Anopheles nili]